MSWIISLLVSIAIGGVTVAITLVLLRRQRRRFERLLADFGGQQLVTNKRLTEILLKHQKKHDELAQHIEWSLEANARTRRDLETLNDRTNALLLEEDEFPAPREPHKWVN